MRIALLEDDKDQADLVCAWLANAGHQCRHFETSRDFLRGVLRDSYELLILDWMVPKMDGMEVMARVRDSLKNYTPVLFMTARDQEDDVVRALEDVLGIGVERAGELGTAMEIIAEEGRGVVCLFREPHPKLDIPEEDGPRTIKHTGLGAQILSAMGLHDLVLLTNSPQTKYVGLDAYDLRIAGTRPITKD